ncbi:aromatic compound dioxygenase [Mycena floridula]|nr:aromatic compound dioxygenase [Mycena floridula]
MPTIMLKTLASEPTISALRSYINLVPRISYLLDKMRFSTLVHLAVVCGLTAALPSTRDLTARTIWPGLMDQTCNVTPEMPQGSENYVTPLVRLDARDGQAGIPLTLDIGIRDVTTCNALPGVMVEIWGPNALGQYGSTFLRAATLSTSNGIAEIQTIWPGPTASAASHVNVAVHSGATLSSPIIHVGRIYFNDNWNNLVLNYGVYQSNTNARMKDSADPISSDCSITSIGDDWIDPEGVVGYITIGVNPH